MLWQRLKKLCSEMEMDDCIACSSSKLVIDCRNYSEELIPDIGVPLIFFFEELVYKYNFSFIKLHLLIKIKKAHANFHGIIGQPF